MNIPMIFNVILYSLLVGATTTRLQTEALDRLAQTAADDIEVLLSMQSNLLAEADAANPYVTFTADAANPAKKQKNAETVMLDYGVSLGLQRRADHYDIFEAADGGAPPCPPVINPPGSPPRYRYHCEYGIGHVYLRANVGEGLSGAEAKAAAIRVAKRIGGDTWVNEDTYIHKLEGGDPGDGDGYIEIGLPEFAGLPDGVTITSLYGSRYLPRNGASPMIGNLSFAVDSDGDANLNIEDVAVVAAETLTADGATIGGQVSLQSIHYLDPSSP